MKSDWSPTQYLKFEDHRTRPATDLLSRVTTTDPSMVTDVGCGPGNSTELLVARFPRAVTCGFDTSEKMVNAAQERLPAQKFEMADVTTWTPSQPQDLIFSNAVLQWVPDHGTLLPRLMSYLGQKGTLAIQMPDNLDQPSHTSMRAAAEDPRWSSRLKAADAARTEILSAEDYWSVLHDHASAIEIWRTIYYHPLQGLEGIVDWFKGTGLLPYLNLLRDDEKEDYLTKYKGYLAEHYTVMRDGTVLLAFPRLFIIASR